MEGLAQDEEHVVLQVGAEAEHGLHGREQAGGDEWGLVRDVLHGVLQLGSVLQEHVGVVAHKLLQEGDVLQLGASAAESRPPPPASCGGVGGHAPHNMVKDALQDFHPYHIVEEEYPLQNRHAHQTRQQRRGERCRPGARLSVLRVPVAAAVHVAEDDVRLKVHDVRRWRARGHNRLVTVHQAAPQPNNARQEVVPAMAAPVDNVQDDPVQACVDELRLRVPSL
mmetsp:Transcript_124511/g.215803  ORF Transcript_124511/g.215803 Transcript_124511/m.215803 type:complete len:224 (-) Transcript_124511:300-971(-)